MFGQVEQMIGGVVSQIDPMVIKIVLVMLVIGLILAIIKKAAKIVIAVVLAVLLVAGLGMYSEKYQDKWNVKMDEDSIDLVLDGKEYSIDKSVTNITFTRKPDGSYIMRAQYSDGNLEVPVPSFVKTIITVKDKIFEAPIEVID